MPTYQSFDDMTNGRNWPGPEIPAINLIAENQPFDFAWHEEFRCKRHRPLMADSTPRQLHRLAVIQPYLRLTLMPAAFFVQP